MLAHRMSWSSWWNCRSRGAPGAARKHGLSRTCLGAAEQTGDAVGLGLERLELLPPVYPALLAGTAVEEAVDTLGALRRRQINKGQKALALEMRALGLEHGTALAIDQKRDRVREEAFRIPGRLVAQRLE